MSRKKEVLPDPPAGTDEYRTPWGLGTAMARAADVQQFDLDPFAAADGYNGIPARECIHWRMDAYKTLPQTPPRSIGFNIPFSEPLKALDRIEKLAGDDIPVVGIVRADPSTEWWTERVIEWYDWCVFTPRILFWNAHGQQTTGSPRGGVAIVGRHAPKAWAVEQCIRELYKRAWLVRI